MGIGLRNTKDTCGTFVTSSDTRCVWIQFRKNSSQANNSYRKCKKCERYTRHRRDSPFQWQCKICLLTGQMHIKNCSHFIILSSFRFVWKSLTLLLFCLPFWETLRANITFFLNTPTFVTFVTSFYHPNHKKLTDQITRETIRSTFIAVVCSFCLYLWTKMHKVSLRPCSVPNADMRSSILVQFLRCWQNWKWQSLLCF